MSDSVQIPLMETLVALAFSAVIAAALLRLRAHLNELNRAYNDLPLPTTTTSPQTRDSERRQISRTTWLLKLLLLAWPIPLAVLADHLLALNEKILEVALPGVGIAVILAFVLGLLGKLKFAKISDPAIDGPMVTTLSLIGFVVCFSAMLCLRILPNAELRAQLVAKLLGLGG